MHDRVEIDEIVADVHVFDDELMLSPRLIEQVTARVLARVRDDEGHRERVREEQRIGPEAAT
jgi:hypothetical protein